MLERSDGTRNGGYLVPCLFKAVQMIEALRKTRAGLRVEDFLEMTRYSRSTIYRILRTLIACDYIVRDSAGGYRLNYAVISAAEDEAWSQTSRGTGTPSLRPNDKDLEFERWGVRFHADGRRLERTSGAIESDCQEQ